MIITPNNPINVCVVRLSALGDVLMLVPLIKTLQKNLPKGSKVTWIISPPASELVSSLNDVDFIVVNKPKNLKSYINFKAIIKHYNFDVLLACQASFRANLLYPLIKAKIKIGYDWLRAKDLHWLFINKTITPGKDHTVEGFLKFADTLFQYSSKYGSLNKDLTWDLNIASEDKIWAATNCGSQPYIVINPASSKAERCWLISRYVELINYLHDVYKMNVVLTGGPTSLDYEISNKIVSQINSKNSNIVNLVGKTKPPQLLAIIAGATCLISPDTGPAHMACAVNTPVVALHAVTPSAVSGPYNFRHLCVDYYNAAIKISGIKKPKWGKHAHGEGSMKLIQVRDVIEKIKLILN